MDPTPPSGAAGATRFLPGTLIAGGRFRIVSLLGVGGMGEVYRADDLAVGGTVALKFLPRDHERDAAWLRRFRDEVRLARELSHPHLCRIHDLGEHQGSLFLAMEYIEGEDLLRLLRRIGPLPRHKTLQLAHQLLSGLAAIHDRGILHRDLKPANVMIDEHGRAKITDFGLAGWMQRIRHPGEGTVPYMAPEQLTGEQVSVRSDLYALGLVLYEMGTGERAFAGEERPELTPPTRLRDDFEPQLEQLVLRCASQAPADRPASARQAAEALPAPQPPAAEEGERYPPVDALLLPRRHEQLAPRAAWGWLLVLALALTAVAWLGERTSLARRVHFAEPPLVLAAQARGVLRDLGYEAAPQDDRLYGFTYARGGEPELRFWYRESPRPLLPVRAGSAFRRADDPPVTEPGMVRVDLGAGGALRRLDAVAVSGAEFWQQPAAAGGIGGAEPAAKEVPPAGDPLLAGGPSSSAALPVGALPLAGTTTTSLQPPEPAGQGLLATGGTTRSAPSGSAWPSASAPPLAAGAPSTSAAAAAPEWRALLAAAGVAAGSGVAGPPSWRPPVFADRRAAWIVRPTERQPAGRRIEVAALGGRPVALRLFGRGEAPGGGPGSPAWMSGSRVVQLAFSLCFAVALVGSLLLARRHLRRRCADRRAGLRLAAYVVAARAAVWALGAHHVMEPAELYSFWAHLAWSLFYGGLAWSLHTALEPLLRRARGERMASWARLLHGRYRDALVGRDLLIGVGVGTVTVCWAQLCALLAGPRGSVSPPAEVGALAWQVQRSALDQQLEALRGLRHTLAVALHAHVESLVVALFAIAGFFLVRLLLRRSWPAVAAALLVCLLLLDPGGGTSASVIVATLGACGLWLLVLLRLGFLPAVITVVTSGLLTAVPLTPHLAAWYGRGSAVVLGALALAGLYGFRTALGDRPLLERNLR